MATPCTWPHAHARAEDVGDDEEMFTGFDVDDDDLPGEAQNLQLQQCGWLRYRLALAHALVEVAAVWVAAWGSG